MITRNKVEFYTGDVRFSTCLKYHKREIEESRALRNGKNVVLAKVKGQPTYILVKEALKDTASANTEDFFNIKDKSNVTRAAEYYAENVTKIENPNPAQQAQIEEFLKRFYPKNSISQYLNKKFKPTVEDIIIK